MAKHILVVEGERVVRDTIAQLLSREGFTVHLAESHEEAARLSRALPELALVVSETHPREGARTLEEVRAVHPDVRAVLVADSSDERHPLADEQLPKPVVVADLLETISRLNRDLEVERDHREMLDSLRENVVSMVNSLAAALEARDPYTAGHSQRVADYSLMIADELGLCELEREVLRHGAVLHDIGKIAIRQEVLNKPGRLSEDEFEHIKLHPVVGREILEPIDDFKAMLDLVYYHHERIDGKGYPEGLAGEQIPLLAQIVAVADTYDAMTSDRPYRQGMPMEKALAIMTDVAGSQLNAEFVTILARRLRAGLAAGTDAPVASLAERKDAETTAQP